MAANASINACMSYLLLAFCVFGDDTCSLLIQNMNDTLGATVNQGVHQYNGDCNNQALYCGNQRCRDTARHVLGITSTEDGNSLEGFDHTGYGTQQTQKRCNSSDDLQYSQAAFDTGTLFQNSLFQFQFKRFIVCLRIVFSHFQYTTQRVVQVRLGRLQLRICFGVYAKEHEDTPQAEQQTEYTDGGNNVTNQAAVMELLTESFLIDQCSQQRTTGRAGWVDTYANQTRGSVLQFSSTGSKTVRLTRQLFDIGTIEAQVLAVRNQVPDTDTNDFLLTSFTVWLDHHAVEFGNATTFDHFTLNFVPQTLNLSDCRQLGITVHLVDQVFEEVTAVGVLGAYQRVFSSNTQVTSS